MTNEQKALVDFHRKFQLTENKIPTFDILMIDKELRVNLIHEENTELKEARNIYDVADALGDLLYVVLGAAVTYGIDLAPIFEEIHRSNMTKLWTIGEINAADVNFKAMHNIICVDQSGAVLGERSFLVKRVTDGKVIKSPFYSPANIKEVLDKQMIL